jgi:hypothetical protein
LVPARTAKEKAFWQCRYKHKWWAESGRVLRNETWCPTCAKKFRKFENDIFYSIWYSFPDADQNIRGILKNKQFELDIWIPSLRKAIECDGETWHSRPVNVERDARKNKECEEFGIKLLRIKYKEWTKDRFAAIVKVIEFLTE